jgi:hypothetical protein
MLPASRGEGMGKTILKGIAGLFVAFCIGMTVVAVWRAFTQTSGDAVAALTINSDPGDIYGVVTDPAAFPDWSGWRRQDRRAVFSTRDGNDRPTICWSGKKLGVGCFVRGPSDPTQTVVLFTLSPAVVRDGKPEPAAAEEETGAYRLTIEPAKRGGAVVTLAFVEPEAQGLMARLFALLSHGEDERRAADMLAALKTYMRKA